MIRYFLYFVNCGRGTPPNARTLGREERKNNVKAAHIGATSKVAIESQEVGTKSSQPLSTNLPVSIKAAQFFPDYLRSYLNRNACKDIELAQDLIQIVNLLTVNHGLLTLECDLHKSSLLHVLVHGHCHHFTGHGGGIELATVLNRLIAGTNDQIVDRGVAHISLQQTGHHAHHGAGNVTQRQRERRRVGNQERTLDIGSVLGKGRHGLRVRDIGAVQVIHPAEMHNLVNLDGRRQQPQTRRRGAVHAQRTPALLLADEGAHQEVGKLGGVLHGDDLRINGHVGSSRDDQLGHSESEERGVQTALRLLLQQLGVRLGLVLSLAEGSGVQGHVGNLSYLELLLVPDVIRQVHVKRVQTDREGGRTPDLAGHAHADPVRGDGLDGAVHKGKAVPIDVATYYLRDDQEEARRGHTSLSANRVGGS